MAGSTRELAAAARAKWRSSGLTDAQARRLRFEVMTAEQVAALGPPFAAAGGLRIPYFDAGGRPTKFFRLRYLEALPGFAGASAKPQRYVQPARTLNEVYAPPLLDTSWREVLADSAVTIYITEGELKAAAGCAAGLATLGLGGVDVWRAGRRGIDLLPMLRGATWNNRDVVIVYDSDAATNSSIVRAETSLAHELSELGAEPRVAALPPAEDGGKQGLDDFLARHGAEALQALLEEATPWAEATALWELNEEVAYIRDPGMVVRRASGQMMAPNSFTAHAYANRHYLEVTERGAKTKPTAKRWLEWPQRFELARVTYQPGSPQVVDDMWNTWPGWGCEPREGSVRYWTELLDYMFKDAEPAARRWFEQWCAYPIQHPGTKLFSSVLMWGLKQGTGKTFIAYALGEVYGRNFTEVKSKELQGAFNSWAQNKQFVYGDEITGGDKAAKRIDADYLKGIVTQQSVRINTKFVPEYVVPDVINYYFTSNHPDALFIEDSDRRYFINEVLGAGLSKTFFKEMEAWLYRGPGPGALFYHLLRVPLDGFNPRGDAFQTASKMAMIHDNKSDLGAWCAALQADPAALLRAAHMNGASDCDLFAPAQLHQVYDPAGRTPVTVNGLARELRRTGFRQVNNGGTVRTASGCLRLYAVRDPEKWTRASVAECAAHWNKFFGPKEAKYK